jgi:hypothetical protein
MATLGALPDEFFLWIVLHQMVPEECPCKKSFCLVDAQEELQARLGSNSQLGCSFLVFFLLYYTKLLMKNVGAMQEGSSFEL